MEDLEVGGQRRGLGAEWYRPGSSGTGTQTDQVN